MATDLVSRITQETELNTPDASGNTLKENLEFIERTKPSGWARSEKLDVVGFTVPSRFHMYGSAIFQLHCSLSAGRQAGNNGLQPLSWSDMKAWIEINEYSLDSFEVDTLKAMDMAYVSTFNRLMSERSK